MSENKNVCVCKLFSKENEYGRNLRMYNSKRFAVKTTISRTDEKDIFD
jgi:hypothetical protein